MKCSFKTPLMKPVLYILFILMIFNLYIAETADAQSYNPTATEGAHWIVKHEIDGWEVLAMWEYYCNGDSVIDGVEYKKVFRRELEPTLDPPPFSPISSYVLFGFLRDDIINKKVYGLASQEYWYSYCSSETEFLLFDFSLQPGDPVNQCTMPSFYQDTIASITSGNAYGIDTRIFTTLYQGFNFYEGIGSDFGLFEEMFLPVDKGRDLENTELVYYCNSSPCNYVLEEMTLLTVGEVFDFEIGDQFQYRGSATGQPPNAERIDITGKYYSTSNDTVFYVRYHHSYSSTIIYENGQPVINYSFYNYTDTVNYTSLTEPISSYDDGFLQNWVNYILSVGFCDSTFNGYRGTSGQGFEDNIWFREYGKGLGQVRDYYYDGTGGISTLNNQLFYYKKGNETCGIPDVVNTDNIPISKELSLYPNPAKDVVSFNIDKEVNVTFAIWNMTGRQIQSGKAHQGLNTIDIKNLSPGVYFLKLGTEREVKVLKFVKS